jgi:hypothetical protein
MSMILKDSEFLKMSLYQTIKNTFKAFIILIEDKEN